MSGENRFSPAERLSMQQAQEAHMMDAGKVLTLTAGAKDEYGNPSESWAANPDVEIPCGFQFANSTSEGLGESEVVLIDAKLRLPRYTSITSANRWRLTRRFGQALTTSIDFEVIGKPKQGPSGLYLELKRVADST